MFRGLYGQASRSAYRHNSAWPTLPYRSTFAILKQPNIMEIKKDVGVKSLRAYPNYQALALPLGKDKQRKPAHARWYIHTLPLTHFTPLNYIYAKTLLLSREYLPYYIYKGSFVRHRWHINHLNADASVASPLYLDSKLRSLILQTGNVKKTSLETGRTTGLKSLSTKLFFATRPRANRLYTVQR